MSKVVIWEDECGRKHGSLLPDHAPDGEAHKGVTMLSVDVDELGLPEPQATNLHNQLVSRELWDWPAIKKKGGVDGLRAALMGALKVDVVKLMSLYRREDG